MARITRDPVKTRKHVKESSTVTLVESLVVEEEAGRVLPINGRNQVRQNVMQRLGTATLFVSPIPIVSPDMIRQSFEATSGISESVRSDSLTF